MKLIMILYNKFTDLLENILYNINKFTPVYKIYCYLKTKKFIRNKRFKDYAQFKQFIKVCLKYDCLTAKHEWKLDKYYREKIVYLRLLKEEDKNEV